MSLLSMYDRAADTVDLKAEVALSRDEIISRLAQKSFDVLVVGGGIHGALFARICALHGLRTTLLEKLDYSFASSSRSSKMAHGGLRYLENLDFAQVFEGLKSRDNLFKIAGHLASPISFAIPIKSDQWWLNLKLSIGLFFYNILSGKFRLPEKLPPAIFQELSQSLPKKVLAYSDGVMNDCRLTLENIRAAREEGALCLNYAEVGSHRTLEDGVLEVSWIDTLTGKQHLLKTGAIVNCSGASAQSFARISEKHGSPGLRFSRGTHLLFDCPWKGPALLLPVGTTNLYYFVWPFLGKTLVGTTEKEIETPEEDPQPLSSEVSELLKRLTVDLPKSELTTDKLYYAFTGIRALPARSKAARTSDLSRKHTWIYFNGVLSLLGGKFTTAAWTVEQGFKTLCKLAHLNYSPSVLRDRRLPGFAKNGAIIAEFRRVAETQQVPGATVERIVGQLGTQVAYFDRADKFRILGKGELLAGEVTFAIEVEQAETLDDLMRRRLQIEFLPGHGVNLLDEVLEILGQNKPTLNLNLEKQNYLNRIAAVKKVLQEAQA